MSNEVRKRVPLDITLSAEDFEFARALIASDDPQARDDFFMAAIHALRQQVMAAHEYLEKCGLEDNDVLKRLRYDIVVRLEAH